MDSLKTVEIDPDPETAVNDNFNSKIGSSGKIDEILIGTKDAVNQEQFPDEKYSLTPKESIDPSYSNLVLPYRVICRQRYQKSGAELRAQFIREIKQHALLQNNALDGVRIHRIFSNPIITKPKPDELIKLTKEQERKIEAILRRSF